MEIAPEDLQSITDNVWTTTMGLPVLPWLLETPCLERDAEALAGTIAIDGAWRGGVTLSCPRALARLVARVIFGLDGDDAPEPTASQMEDALAELTNMTGGNLKALLPEPCVLSLPRIATPEAALQHPGALFAEASFECGGEPFVVRVYEEAVLAEAALS